MLPHISLLLSVYVHARACVRAFGPIAECDTGQILLLFISFTGWSRVQITHRWLHTAEQLDKNRYTLR